MARISWKTYRFYPGLPGNPVALSDHYRLSDTPFDAAAARTASPPFRRQAGPARRPEFRFGRYADRIADLTPKAQMLTDGRQSLPGEIRHAAPARCFSTSREYGHLLMSDFFAAGGKIVIREFHSPSELAHLPEKVIINCPGYAAHDWWKDKAMVPVRGQTEWLIPQPEVNYGLTYRNVETRSKSDGIMVIALENGDLKGYNDSDKSVRRAESERAVRVIEELYSRFPQSGVII